MHCSAEEVELYRHARRGGGSAPLPRRGAGSTRSCRARARSSARFAPRTRRALAALFSTGSSARRCGSGRRSGPRPRSARAPRRSRRRPPRSPSRCSESSRAARCLLVGAGEVSELAARSARRARRDDRGGHEPDAGERRAARRGSSTRAAVPFDRARTGARTQADVVVVLDELARARSSRRPDARTRKGRPLFVIDLAVPRDVDPAVAELEDCYLYDIDDLAGRCQREPQRKAPRGGAGRGDRRSRRSGGSATGRRACDVVPAIASLRERAESIRSGELAKAEGRLEGLSESERRDGRVADDADREQAPARSDRAAEGGRRDGRRGLRRGRAAPLRARRGRELLRIGSRGSRLALTQAELAADRLRGPGIEIALVPITTAGDRDRTKPFGEIGERGVFVKELEEALLDGRIDVAVHSAKDMTSTDTEGLVVGAYLRAGGSTRRALRRERDQARDAHRHRLGSPAGPAARARAVALDRASPRQHRHAAAQARRARASTRSCSRRAGSTGSGSASEIGHRFDPEELLPEAGQGALALQVRAGEEELVVGRRRPRRRAAGRGRARCVAAIGGGCLAPIAAHHDGDDADRRSSPTRTAAGSSGGPATTRPRSRRSWPLLAA